MKQYRMRGVFAFFILIFASALVAHAQEERRLALQFLCK